MCKYTYIIEHIAGFFQVYLLLLFFLVVFGCEQLVEGGIEFGKDIVDEIVIYFG
jgi:uncharacterized membrane protein YhaH (DUF805 family)